jgi:hypothetical protein
MTHERKKESGRVTEPTTSKGRATGRGATTLSKRKKGKRPAGWMSFTQSGGPAGGSNIIAPQDTPQNNI